MDITMEHLSYSRIRAWCNCSLAYFFRYISREPPEFTPAALAFGSAFHRAAEESLVQKMAGVEPCPDELVRVFEASLDESEAQAPIRWGEREDRGAAVEQARRMLAAWLSSELPVGRILGVEHAFEIELAPWLPKLQGRADLVIEMSDSIAILDIKTSRTHWDADDIEAGQDQLLLYREGLADFVASTGKAVKLGWIVIGKVKQPWIETVWLTEPPPTARRPINAATLVLEAVERGLFLPNPGWACATCPFRKACRAW